jgi:hypothetical protein
MCRCEGEARNVEREFSCIYSKKFLIFLCYKGLTGRGGSGIAVHRLVEYPFLRRLLPAPSFGSIVLPKDGRALCSYCYAR